MISSALCPHNSNAWRVRNWTLDSIFSRAWQLINSSAKCLLDNVSPISSVFVERTRVPSRTSLWPVDYSRSLKPLPSQVASSKLLYPSEIHRRIIVGDATSVVYPYPYMAKWAVMRLVIMNRYFLFSEFLWWKFYLWVMRRVTKFRNLVESLFLWYRESCCWRRWSKKDYWCCCCWQWSNGDCWGCSWKRFFPFKHLCKVLEVLSSLLQIVFTYSLHLRYAHCHSDGHLIMIYLIT